MGSYWEHKKEESVDLTYSFRCEQCMRDSGPRKATVTGSAHTNSNFKEISDKRNDKLREAAHKNLVNSISKLYQDAVEKQVISTIFQDECPHCHKPQSWGVSGMKKEMYQGLAVFLVTGLLISAVGFCLYKTEQVDYLTMPIIIGIAAAGAIAALVTLIWNIVKIQGKRKKTDMSMQKNLPVIEWGAVQYLLDEAK